MKLLKGHFHVPRDCKYAVYIRTHGCEDPFLPLAAPLSSAHFAAGHASGCCAAVQQIQGRHSYVGFHELGTQHEVKALTPGFTLPACADADFAWSFELLLASSLAFSSA